MGYRLLAQAFDQSEEAFDEAVRSFRDLLKRDATNHGLATSRLSRDVPPSFSAGGFERA